MNLKHETASFRATKILTSSSLSINRLDRKANYSATSNNMKLVHWYTKIQNIGTGVAPRTVHIDNQAIETVSKFTYLGSDIDSDGYSYPEIHRRIGIAGSIMAQLDNVWR